MTSYRLQAVLEVQPLDGVPAWPLPGLLADVRVDLTAFLSAVRAWAGRHGVAPEPLAGILDRSFRMTEPWEL